MMNRQLIAQWPQDWRVLHSSEPRIEGRLASGADGDLGLCFRRFTVLPHRRELLADGRPVELGSRAYDLLIALVKARGTLVTKAEIFRHVWPSTTVEESNLRVQIATLRKALGKDRDVIKTVTGRGYIFVSEATAGSPELMPSVSAPDFAKSQPVMIAMAVTLSNSRLRS
jgi:DNA-binding winged helix-turn-helix (wHTH) protein